MEIQKLHPIYQNNTWQGLVKNTSIVDKNEMVFIIFRRQVKKSKSVIHLLFFNEPVEDDIKSRNIRQTEILVDLREAILQVNFFGNVFAWVLNDFFFR